MVDPDLTVPRSLSSGLALFEAVDDDLLPIKPIAIQLTQSEDEIAPIFTPDDPQYTWMIAKSCFESADFM